MRRPWLKTCDHSVTISTETAGLARTVCERCGHVSIRFAREVVVSLTFENHRLPSQVPSTAPPAMETSGGSQPQRLCMICGASATYMIRGGLACTAHAWAAAAAQESLDSEIWIPIRIDQTRTGG
jgi:hypothetical protein